MIADFEQDDYDRQQRNKLGVMVIIMSAGMLVMMLIPNPLWGRLMFLGCAVIMLAIGLLLKHSAKKAPTTATSSLSKKPCLE